MEFRISEQTAQRLTLRASTGYRLISIILTCLAVPALPLGVLLILVEPRQAAAHALLGLGIFFWGASRIVERGRRVQPAGLVFDNAEGVLRILQNRRGKTDEEATVAYQQISGFRSVARHDEGTTRWCTALEFSDGTMLPLQSFASPAKAQSETQRFEQQVALSVAGPQQAPTLPEGVAGREQPGATVFRWDFGFLRLQNLSALAAVCGFLWAMFSFVSADDRFGKYAVVLFAAVLLAVVGWFAARWIGAHGELEIAENEIRYFEIRGFKKRLRHAIPRAELDRVAFAAGTAGDSAIWFLRRGESEQMRRIALGEVGLADIPAALSFMQRAFKIYTPTLNFSERLRFAQAIKAKLPLPPI